MTILVTGGAGFIGSNLVDALLDRGDDVHVVDNLSSGRRENLAAALERGAVLHEVDIRDKDALRAAKIISGCASEPPVDREPQSVL